MKEIVFEEGSKLKTVKEYAFNECSYIEKINLPEGLKSIERNVFSSCKNLKSIWLPNSLRKIGVQCF